MTISPHRPPRAEAGLRGVLAAFLLALLAPGLAWAAETRRPALHLEGPARLIAGHFQLQDTSGRTVDSDALAGRPYGLFFGFTGCPDICPTTLARLSLALAAIPDPDLRIYFVTVDPERDTGALLGAYMQSFDPRIVALTGDRPAVQEALASFGAAAERTALPSGGYSFAHTAVVLLVDENGLITDRVTAEIDPSALEARLAPLARATARAEAGP